MRKVAEILGLGCVLFFAPCAPSLAQTWPSWAEDLFEDRRGYGRQPRWQDYDRPSRTEDQRGRRATEGDLRDGGARPDIAAVAPPIAAFAHDYPANSIVIDTGGRKLYYVLPDKRAYAYPISVGREGFNWTGTETVSRKQAWPDWYPPAEMRERDSSLPEKMTGGLKNPLGAMALYLGNTLYRIHGTNDVKSIGQAQSSGCFRMLNSAVLHLASITEVGTPVSVVASLPARQEVSRAPEPLPIAVSQPPATSVRSVPAASPDRVPDYRALRDYTLGRP